MQPKVSIIIPVYNVEQYLTECLDSVIHQTMKDMEVICIDDGSNDGSRRILTEYAEKDRRIIILDKPNGGGPGAARNIAYPNIRGIYTLFVDSDDYLDLALCEKTIDQADNYQADIVVFSYKTFPGRSSNPFRSIDVNGITAATPLDCLEEKKRYGLFTRFITPWCKLFRSEFLLQNGIDFPEYAYFDDNGMNWKAMVMAGKITFLPEQLYFHRYRLGSIMRPSGKKYLNGVRAFSKAKRDMIDCGVYDQIRDFFLNEWLGHLRTYYRIVSGVERPDVRKRIINSLGDSEWDFLRHSPNVKPKLRSFYRRIQKPVSWNLTVWVSISNLIEKIKILFKLMNGYIR